MNHSLQWFTPRWLAAINHDDVVTIEIEMDVASAHAYLNQTPRKVWVASLYSSS